MLKYILICIVLSVINLARLEMSITDCRQKGFIKPQLMCSNCDKLVDFGLESIKQTCRECCTMDELTGDQQQQRYPMAVLEVCTCKFRAYPQIQAFIKSGRPAKFPNLTIKYVRGLDPIIKLLDDNGRVKETLSITKWNTDTVEEFFETHLEKQSSSAATGKDTKKQSSYSIVEDNNEAVSDDIEDFLRTNFV